MLLRIVISDMACSILDAAREEARCDPTDQTKTRTAVYFILQRIWLIS